MKYLVRKCNKQLIKLNVQHGNRTKLYRTESVVDEFYTERGISQHSGTSFVRHIDPIYMLFNQQRLSQLGADSAKYYLDSLMQQGVSSQLAELRKQVSDEDLLATIKSRHIQTATELSDWCNYMSKNMDNFKSKVSEVVAKQQAQLQQIKSNNQGAAT